MQLFAHFYNRVKETENEISKVQRRIYKESNKDAYIESSFITKSKSLKASLIG
jgi:hypothetical protein